MVVKNYVNKLLFKLLRVEGINKPLQKESETQGGSLEVEGWGVQGMTSW